MMPSFFFFFCLCSGFFVLILVLFGFCFWLKLLLVGYVLYLVLWTVLWGCRDQECGGGTWSAGQGQPLLSMRNSQMAGDSWGNSCKCNLRGCLICGIAQACIHCILGLLWRNILNKSRWLCSVSQFKTGLLTTFWRWLSLALGPARSWPYSIVLPVPSRLVCGCFDSACHCFIWGKNGLLLWKFSYPHLMLVTGVPVVHVGSTAPAVSTLCQVCTPHGL